MQSLLGSCKSTAVWILKARHCLPSRSSHDVSTRGWSHPMSADHTPGTDWHRHRSSRPGLPRIERRAEWPESLRALITWTSVLLPESENTRNMSTKCHQEALNWWLLPKMHYAETWQLASVAHCLGGCWPDLGGQRGQESSWSVPGGDHWPRRLQPHVTGHIMGRGGNSFLRLQAVSRRPEADKRYYRSPDFTHLHELWCRVSVIPQLLSNWINSSEWMFSRSSIIQNIQSLD